MQRALQTGGKVYAVKIEGVAGLAQHPTQPDTTFLDELRGRVRVIACLDEAPIVLSGAAMPEFPDKLGILERLRKRVKPGENDDFFIVFGPEEDCRTAAEEIRIRFADATVGVPKETRQALVGGYTTFERILPGPDRMYPDTDSPPSRITQERIEEIRARLRPPPWERIERYTSWRLPEETASYLIRRGGAEIVDAVVEKTGVDGLLAGITIGQHCKALNRAGVPVERLRTPEWIQVFDMYTDGRIPREFIPAVAARMACDGLDAAGAAAALGVALQPRESWTKEADRLTFDDYRCVKDDSPEKRTRFLAGQAVKMLKGQAPAAEVAEFVKTKIEEVAQ